MSRQDRLTPPVSSVTSEGFEDDLTLEINLRLHFDEVAGFEATLLRTGARRQPTAKDLRRLAKNIFEARRLRDRVLDNELLGEPGWDMLLALYYMPASGCMLTVSGLSCCAGAPTTTAHRWQRLLFAHKLIERAPHDSDKRMQLVGLTERGRALMTQYLTRLFHCSQFNEP